MKIQLGQIFYWDESRWVAAYHNDSLWNKSYGSGLVVSYDDEIVVLWGRITSSQMGMTFKGYPELFENHASWETYADKLKDKKEATNANSPF